MKSNLTSEVTSNTNNLNNTDKVVSANQKMIIANGKQIANLTNQVTANTKTIQQIQHQQITHTAVGGAGLGFGILTSLILLGIGAFKLWSTKKGKAFIKRLIEDVDHEILKVKEEWMDAKQDVLLNPTYTQDDKLKTVKALNDKYKAQLDHLEEKRQEHLNKLNRGK